MNIPFACLQMTSPNCPNWEDENPLTSLVQKLSHRLPDIRDRAMHGLSEKIQNPAIREKTLISLAENYQFPFSALHWLNDRYADLKSSDLRAALHALAVAAGNEKIRKRLQEAGANSFFIEFAEHVPALRTEVEDVITSLANGSVAVRVAPAVVHAPEPFKPLLTFSAENRLIDLSASEEQRIFDAAVRIKFPQNTANLISAVAEFSLGVFVDFPPEVFIQRPACIEAIFSKISETRDLVATSALLSALLSLLGKLSRHNPPKEGVLLPSVLAGLSAICGSSPHLGAEILTAVFAHQVNWTREDAELCMRQVSEILKNFTDDDWTPQKKFSVTAILAVLKSLRPVLAETIRRGCAGLEIFSFAEEWLADPHAHAIFAKGELLDLAEILTFIGATRMTANFSRASKSARAVASMKTGITQETAPLILELFRSPFNFLTVSPEELIGTMLKNPDLPGHIFADAAALHADFASCVAAAVENSLLPLSDEFLAFAAARISGPARRRILSVAPDELKDWVDVALGEAGPMRGLFSRHPEIRRKSALHIWRADLCDVEGCAFVVDLFENSQNIFDAAEKIFLKRKLEKIIATANEISATVEIACNEKIPATLRATSASQAATLLANYSGERNFFNVDSLLAAYAAADGELSARLAEVLCLCKFSETPEVFLLEIAKKVFSSAAPEHTVLFSSALFPEENLSLGSLASTNDMRNIAREYLVPHIIGASETSASDLSEAEVTLIKNLANPAERFFFVENSEEAWFANFPQISTSGYLSSLAHALETPPPFWESGIAVDEKCMRYYEHLCAALRFLRKQPAAFADISERILAALDRGFSAAKKNSAVPAWCWAAAIGSVAEIFSLAQEWKIPLTFRASSWIKFAVDCLPRGGPLATASLLLLNALLAFPEISSGIPAIFEFCLVGEPASRAAACAALRACAAVPGPLTVFDGQRVFSAVGKFVISETPEIQALAWRLSRNFAEISDDEVKINFLSKATDQVLSTEKTLATFGASEFLSCVILRGDADCEIEKILAAVGLASFWESGDLPASSFSTLRIDLLAACAARAPCEVSRFLVLADRWPFVFSAGAASAELAAACIRAERHLLIYLSQCGLLKAISNFGEISAAIATIAAEAAAAEKRHLAGGAGFFGENFQRRVCEGLQSVDVEKFENACAAAMALGNFRASEVSSDLIEALIPHLSEDSAAAALAAILDANDSENVPALNALAKTSLSSSAGSTLPLQMRLLAVWSSKLAGASETFNDWFCTMWKRWDSSPEMQEELIDCLGLFLKNNPRASAVTPALSFILAACTQKKIPTALLSRALAVAALAREILVNKAATGRILGSLLAVHAPFTVKNLPRDSAACAKLGCVLNFAIAMVSCKLSAAALAAAADDLASVALLVGDKFPANLFSIALLNAASTEDAQPRRSLAYCAPVIEFLDSRGDDSAVLCLKILATVKR